MPFDIEAARDTLANAQHYDGEALRERIRALAQPRMSGTEGAEEVEAELRSSLEAAGYEARELPFSFSTWPGRYGLTVAGAILVLTGAGATTLLFLGLPVPALVVLLAGLPLALLPLWGLDAAIRRLPWGRIESHNLLFTRGGTRPSWLVMAHRDSKSQLVPTLLRSGAVVTAFLGWLVLLALAVLWLVDDALRLPVPVLVAAGALVASGLVLALAWAGNDSPGALDNASGLAALLAVAEQERDGRVGFLLTDGEELGLAGARAVVESLPPVQGVINLDGLDDRGHIRLSEGAGWRREGSAPQLAAALLTAGSVLDVDVRRKPLPRSVMVDHAPLAAAGIPALTVVRGGWRSLLRVHRPGDSTDRLTGRGAAETATVLGAALRLLRDSGRATLRGGAEAGHSLSP